MKTVILLLALMVTTNVADAQSTQEPSAQGSELLTLESISAHKLKWEAGWSDDWRATDLEHGFIDHFKGGVVVTWERKEGDLRRIRKDAFTGDRELYWSAEKLYRGTELVARGGIYISADGVPVWRRMAYVGKKRKDEFGDDEYELLYRELELLKNGKPVARYRASSNFRVERVDGEISLTRVPVDTKLIWGKGPTVQELIDSIPD